jgi:hypothetical protein
MEEIVSDKRVFVIVPVGAFVRDELVEPLNIVNVWVRVAEATIVAGDPEWVLVHETLSLLVSADTESDALCVSDPVRICD